MYKSIGYVAKLLAVPSHTLRFWEEQFPYFRPRKIKGHRYYSPDDITFLKQVKVHLKDKGYSIRGVKNIIKAQGMEIFRNGNFENTENVINASIDSDSSLTAKIAANVSIDRKKLTHIVDRLKDIRRAL